MDISQLMQLYQAYQAYQKGMGGTGAGTGQTFPLANTAYQPSKLQGGGKPAQFPTPVAQPATQISGTGTSQPEAPPGDIPQGGISPAYGTEATPQGSTQDTAAIRKARGQLMAQSLANATPPQTTPSGAATALNPTGTFTMDSLALPVNQWPPEWQFILRLLQSIATRQPISFS